MQEKEVALKLELAAARLKQAESEVERHKKAAQGFQQQYEEATDIIADMGAKYQAFEQGIQQNMEASPQSCATACEVDLHMRTRPETDLNAELRASTQTLQGHHAIFGPAIIHAGHLLRLEMG